jgi:pimeloyl-ACP methyl ester carboxylesterase
MNPFFALILFFSFIASSFAYYLQEELVRPKDLEYGTLISANFYPGTNKSEKSEGIIFLHDLGKDQTSFIALEESLKYFSRISFDFRGHGKSLKKLKWNKTLKKHDESSYKPWIDLTIEEKGSQSVFLKEDLNQIITFMGNKNEVHPSKIVLVCEGMGCLVAIRHAEQDEKIIRLVMINPPMSYVKNIKEIANYAVTDFPDDKFFIVETLNKLYNDTYDLSGLKKLVLFTSLHPDYEETKKEFEKKIAGKTHRNSFTIMTVDETKTTTGIKISSWLKAEFKPTAKK